MPTSREPGKCVRAYLIRMVQAMAAVLAMIFIWPLTAVGVLVRVALDRPILTTRDLKPDSATALVFLGSLVGFLILTLW